MRDTLSYFNAADLVITMGGYNTLMDTIWLGKRALVIPRKGPSTEQRTRATVFRNLGLVQTILPEDVTPRRLAGTILEQLDAKLSPHVSLDFNGLSNVVRQMKKLLEPDREGLQSAAPVSLLAAKGSR